MSDLKDLNDGQLREKKKELLLKKDHIEALLHTTKQQIGDAQHAYFNAKKTHTRDEYKKLENKKRELTTSLSKVSIELGEITREMKSRDNGQIEKVFVSVAKEKLTDRLWDEIMSETKIRLLGVK